MQTGARCGQQKTSLHGSCRDVSGRKLLVDLVVVDVRDVAGAKPEFGRELEKERNIMKKIETSALIGLGALGILFGRKMPGVKVIADAERVAR